MRKTLLVVGTCLAGLRVSGCFLFPPNECVGFPLPFFLQPDCFDDPCDDDLMACRGDLFCNDDNPRVCQELPPCESDDGCPAGFTCNLDTNTCR